MSTERELFEAAMSKEGWTHFQMEGGHDEASGAVPVYCDPAMHAAWSAWQAAKSSPSTEVVLPELPEPVNTIFVEEPAGWYGWSSVFNTAQMHAYARSAIALNRGEDAKRLDWLEQRGATVTLMFNGPGNGHDFCVGGLLASRSPTLRAAIDKAMGGKGGEQ